MKVKKMPNIFIVDDDRASRKLYENLCQSRGYNVLHPSARNGKEAIDTLTKFSYKPDVILIDYLMSGEDGLNTAKKILELNNNQKTIIISVDNEIKRKVNSIGSLRFFNKFHSPETFFETIQLTINESFIN
jgi:CheY-like chemotaxis protein